MNDGKSNSSSHAHPPGKVDAAAAKTPVTIRGVGAVGGFGCGRAELLRACRSRPGPNGELEADMGEGKVRKIPGFIADPSPLKEIFGSRRLRHLDRFSRMTALAAYLALEDGGCLDIDRHTLAIAMATGHGANHTTFRFIDDCMLFGDRAASPLLFSGAGHSGVLSNTTILLDIRGGLLTVCQPRLAFSTALTTAVGWLREGRSRAVLVGGAEEYIPLVGYVRNRLTAGKDQASKPAPGEGACFLLLTAEPAKPGECSLVTVAGAVGAEDVDLCRCDIVLAGGGCRSDWNKTTPRPRGVDRQGLFAGANIFGELPTGMAFDLALGTVLLTERSRAGNSGVAAGSPETAPSSLGCVETDGAGRFGMAMVERTKLGE